MISHPSWETHYGMIALSQKGNTCIQVIFTQSSVSMTTTSEYLPVSGFNVPSLHLPQSSRLHPFQVSQKQTATIQATKVIPDLPATLNNCASSRQKHENRLTIKVSCFVSSLIKQFPLPIQFRPSPMTQCMLHSNASTTATQNHECYLMHLRNQNQHSQTGGVYLSLLSLSPLSTNNLNTKFHRAFSAMTVPTFFSLSLSTPVPNCQANTKLLQASVSRSPVQKSVKPHCSCTLPNLRRSTTHILSPD